jgi:branched-chain amino acid transport system ATP-binding protein
MNPILDIKNLNAGYADLAILKDVSLSLTPGTITVLMGPNGAGKSTLLKSIFNLTKITAGEIFFENTDIAHWPVHERLARGIAFVSQGKINFGTLSVQENLEIGAHHVRDNKIIAARLERVTALFPALAAKKNQPAFSLSGGEQQMLALARALMSEPKLLLLDEPSLGLSPKFVKEVFATIVRVRNELGTTILIVEHNLKSLLNLADFGYILVQGEVIASGPCATLKDSPLMQKVFVGELD